MKKFKKITAAILTAALVCTLFSAVAFADDLPSGVSWSGDGTASYDEDTGVLTIDGDGTLTISSEVTASIYVQSGTVSIIVEDSATLEQGSSSTSNVPYTSTIYIALNATVDISGSGTVLNTSSGSGAAAILNNGTCTISEVTVKTEDDNNESWYTILNHGTMTINSGTFSNTASSSKSSLIENGYSETSSNTNEFDDPMDGTNVEKPSLTINGGTFTSTGYNVVKNDDYGYLYIYGGTFDGNYGGNENSGAVIQNYNYAYIYGGTFNAKNGNVVVISSGYYSIEGDACDLYIYDGTFNASNSGVLFGQGSGSGSDNGSVTIYGGNFEGSLELESYNYNVVIYHGDFSDSDAAAYVATEVETVTITDEDGNETMVNVDAVISVETDESTEVHALVKVAAVAATCTTAGNVEYYYCAYGCDSYFIAETDSDGNVTYTEVSLSETIIRATGHTYGNAVETWADDYSSVTVTWTCTVCGYEYSETANNITTAENEDGSITYTAHLDGPPEIMSAGGYDAAVTVDGEEETTSAKTDDASNIALWCVLAAIAALGFGVGATKRKFN